MPSIYLLQILPQLCLLRQMDWLLDKKPDAFNIFIADNFPDHNVC